MSAAEIREWLVREMSKRLGVSASDLDPHASLLDYGLDSFHATTLAGELGRLLGRKLSPVLLWDYPTIDRLSRHLAGESVEAAAEANDVAESSNDPAEAR